MTVPAPVTADTEPERPNILIILTDDQPVEDSLTVMPNVRALFRARGTRFPNGFVTTPLCCPSRSTIPEVPAGRPAGDDVQPEAAPARVFRLSDSSLGGWAATRTRRYGYVEWFADEARSRVSFREYYDLRSDPWRLTNLYHDGVATNDPPTGRLHRRLRADMRCAGAACP